MPIITRIRAGRYEYIGRRGKPVKHRRSARVFRTRADAQAYIDAIPATDRPGWFVDRESGPGSTHVDPKY